MVGSNTDHGIHGGSKKAQNNGVEGTLAMVLRVTERMSTIMGVAVTLVMILMVVLRMSRIMEEQ